MGVAGSGLHRWGRRLLGYAARRVGSIGSPTAGVLGDAVRRANGSGLSGEAALPARVTALASGLLPIAVQRLLEAFAGGCAFDGRNLTRCRGERRRRRHDCTSRQLLAAPEFELEPFLGHHSAPSSVPTARSTARLAASSLQHAPRRRNASCAAVLGVGVLATTQPHHQAEHRAVAAKITIARRDIDGRRTTPGEFRRASCDLGSGQHGVSNCHRICPRSPALAGRRSPRRRSRSRLFVLSIRPR
jgi:hypothetical protein